MNGLRTWLGSVGLALWLASSGEAGSIITLFDATAPRLSALTRDGLAFAGDLPGRAGYAGRWRDGTLTSIEDPTGPTIRSVTGISDDGAVVTGDLHINDGLTFGQDYAFRWENGLLVTLQGPGDNYSVAGPGTSVSADGQIVVGRAGGGGTDRAAFWQGGVRTFLAVPEGTLGSSANGISADGRTIVGTISGPNVTHAVVWRDGVMSILPDLPGGHELPSAINVSADGSVIVGSVDSAAGDSIARWINGDLEVLKQLPPGGSFDLGGTHVSDDGSIVLFTQNLMSEIWREGLGSQPFGLYAEQHFGFSFQDALPDISINVVYINEMTPDGNTFGGVLYDEDSQARSFILYLDPSEFVVPEPSAVTLAGCAAVALLWAHRRSQTPRS